MITKEDIKKAAYESNLGHSTSHNDSFKEGVYWALEQVKNCSIPDVVQRTWLFCGGHGKKYFEIEISAEDRETAIAYFETDYPELKWVMTKEL